MRIVHGIAAASLALLMGVAGTAAALSLEDGSTAATTTQRSVTAAGPLLPLTDRDVTSGGMGAGCTCSFDAGNGTLVAAAGNRLMVRTRAGREVCRMTDARFQQFAGGTGTFACGGVRIGLRPTGQRESSPETDSSGGPARLTMTQGRTSRSVDGEFGCAC